MYKEANVFKLFKVLENTEKHQISYSANILLHLLIFLEILPTPFPYKPWLLINHQARAAGHVRVQSRLCY